MLGFVCTWLNPPSWAISLGRVCFGHRIVLFSSSHFKNFPLAPYFFPHPVKITPSRGFDIQDSYHIAFNRFLGYQKIQLFFNSFRRFFTPWQRGRIAFFFFELSPDFYSYIQKFLSTYLFYSLNVLSENDRNQSWMSLLNFINLIGKQENNINKGEEYQIMCYIGKTEV